MPQPHLRTRSKKRFKVTLPSGEGGTRYKKEVPSTILCSLCSQPLGGVPHATTAEIRKLNRSKRRVWRPYGGQICSNCLKKALRQAARAV